MKLKSIAIFISFSLNNLVTLKRSKSAPGLVESSSRLPFQAPVRRLVSGIQRPSHINEADIDELIGSISGPPPAPLTKESLENPPLSKQDLNSCKSSISTAPLASSISFTSSLHSSRPPVINHSVSWSTATEPHRTKDSNVTRTVSLMNNDLRTRTSSILNADIEQLRQRLIELEKEDLSSNSLYHLEYLQIQNRLKILENSGQ